MKDLRIGFKMTVTQDGVDSSVEHNNLPEDTRVGELLEIFLKGLNNCGYTVDTKMVQDVLDSYANLVSERIRKMYH